MQLALSHVVAIVRPLGPLASNGSRPRPSCSAHVVTGKLARRSAGQRRSVRVARAASVAEAEVPELMSKEELKVALTDSLYGTERGLKADSDTRAEIEELITQLEGKNPTALPNESAGVLDGTWRVVYTSNSELSLLLALASRLPLLEVGDLTQTIDSAAMTVENKVELSAPLSRTALSSSGSLEVRSPKLLQVRLENGVLRTPELLADLELPSSLQVLGQTVDLSALQSALRPLNGPVGALVSGLGSALAGAPDLRFPINAPGSGSWLLTTYVDEDLRITRGDRGSVYVSVKEGAVPAASAWHAEQPAQQAHAAVEEPERVVVVVDEPDSVVMVVEASAVIEEDAGDEAAP